MTNNLRVNKHRMLIVFSSPRPMLNEYDPMKNLFQEGMEYYLLRKPDQDKQKVINFLNPIAMDRRKQVIVHGYPDVAVKYKVGGIHLSSKQGIQEIPEDWKGIVGKSCHSFEEVEAIDGKVDYVFLSPIHDSISKEGYESKFTESELIDFLKNERKTKVIALGGISPENAKSTLDMGFDGLAILGTIWNEVVFTKMINNFKAIQEACQKNSNTALA